MIFKQELTKYTSLLGFDLGKVELDYLQHLFLLFLSEHTTTDFVFKGGTALQKAYGLHRFSIDLDFTQRSKEDPRGLIIAISTKMSAFGYPTTLKEVKTIGRTFILRIAGPLKVETVLSLASLRVEISQRETILLEPKMIEIRPIYPDLRPYTLLVMPEEEIVAEKIRAIMSRNKPRDIFDLHFLLRKGIMINTNFVQQKLAYYHEKYNQKKLLDKIKMMKPLWQNELKDYVTSVPDFEIIFNEIGERLP